MGSRFKPDNWWEAFTMFWLLFAAILGATAPLIVAIAITVLVPGIGELRSTSPWILLHFLWIYPAAWFFSAILDPILNYIFYSKPTRKIRDILGTLLTWLIFSWLCSVFFRDPLGAFLAGLIASLTVKPYIDWLERHTPDDDDPPEDGADSPDG